MHSKSCTLLVGAAVLVAWGSVAELVKGVVREQDVPPELIAMLVVSSVLTVALWIVFRRRGARPEIRAFIGSRGLGVVLITVFCAAFMLPGVVARGLDVVDLVWSGVVVALVIGLTMHWLRRTWFTPPDTPEGLDSE